MLAELLGLPEPFQLKLHETAASPNVAGIMTLLAIVAAWVVHFFGAAQKKQKTYDQEPPTLPYWIPCKTQASRRAH